MAVDDLLYDPAAIEGNTGCSPACINSGVCQNRICFCLSPFGGDYCQIDLGLETRINILLFICMIIGGLVLGFLFVFVFKYIWDWIFVKEPEATKTSADAWQA